MSTRTTGVQISGRKIPGYPTSTFKVSFDSIDDLLIKIDKLIEQTDYGKVDVAVDGDFSKEETKRLQAEWIIVD